MPPSTAHLTRASLRLYGSYRLAGHHLAVFHDLYVMPNVRDLADLRIRASGVVELPLQVIDLLTQTLVLTLQPIALTLGPVSTLAELAGLAHRLVIRLRTSRLGHAIVMPESPRQYKQKLARSRNSRPHYQARTR